MDTREIASEYRRSHWARIMQERNASGKNIRAYCRSSGINEKSYYYWQRKLREAACQELVTATENRGKQGIIPRGWSICKPGEARPGRKALTIEIGGFRISVETEVDPELLTQTCRVLKSLC